MFSVPDVVSEEDKALEEAHRELDAVRTSSATEASSTPVKSKETGSESEGAS